MKTLIIIIITGIAFTCPAQNLISRSREIHNETRVGGITREKVGSLFEDLSRMHIAISYRLDSLIKAMGKIESSRIADSVSVPKIINAPISSKYPITSHDELGNEFFRKPKKQ